MATNWYVCYCEPRKSLGLVAALGVRGVEAECPSFRFRRLVPRRKRVEELELPLIGGISYELIRLSGKYANNPLASWLIAPGLWLQRITTKEPDASQVEVALAALKSALNHEFSPAIQIIKTE